MTGCCKEEEVAGGGAGREGSQWWLFAGLARRPAGELAMRPRVRVCFRRAPKLGSLGFSSPARRPAGAAPPPSVVLATILLVLSRSFSSCQQLDPDTHGLHDQAAIPLEASLLISFPPWSVLASANLRLKPAPDGPALLVLQIRRQARERREYIYKKAHEAQERAIYDRKQAMKDALASGKPLPTELRNEARTAGRDLKYDEAQAGQYARSAPEGCREAASGATGSQDRLDRAWASSRSWGAWQRSSPSNARHLAGRTHDLRVGQAAE